MSPLWTNDGVDGGLVLCGGHAETVSRSQFQSRISLEEGWAAGGPGLVPSGSWRTVHGVGGPSPWASLSVQVHIPTAFSSVFLKAVTTLVPTSSLKKEKEKISLWYNAFRERALRLISGPDPFPIWRCLKNQT